jgi:hypothetical protein
MSHNKINILLLAEEVLGELAKKSRELDFVL